MQLPSDNWFTETCREAGSAFSLKTVRKLADEQTAYQRIEVYETERFGNLMVIDGCVMLSGRDNFLYHEMMAHPVLFTHPDPKRVLIVGGGDCGTLREVLRHSGVERATQVEIDERVTRLAEVHFPELCEANGDPRARFLFEDGIAHVRDAAAGSYDVIIVDSTDPVGPAEGLFTEVFYRDCLAALDERGILVQQSESPLVHIHILCGMRAAMRVAGFADVQTLMFPQPVYPSGWWSATLAVKAGDGQEFRAADAANRGFATRYYNPAIHRAALASPEFLAAAEAGG